MKTKRETVKKLLKRLSAVITALFLVLTTVFALSCGCAPTGTLDGDKESDKAKSEIPAAKTVTDAYAAALYFMAKEEALLSYEIDCKGQSVAKVLFIDYTQDIKSTTIKNDGEYYFYTLSSSSLVTTTQQTFFKDGKVAYRNSDGGDLQ